LIELSISNLWEKLKFRRSFVILINRSFLAISFQIKDVEHELLMMRTLLLIEFVYKCAEFSWDEVKADKYRENYLGHSIKAPVGRWQKGTFSYVHSRWLLICKLTSFHLDDIILLCASLLCSISLEYGQSMVVLL
jgi:hypothetical protein